MNKLPPDRDEPEDVDDHYRRVSALDPSRPSESVRRGVIDHAAQLAKERAAKKEPMRRAARQTWWRPAMVGTLAAAALAGILIAPQFLTPRTPPVAATSPAPDSRPQAGAAPAARAPAAEDSPRMTADKQAPAALAEVQSLVEHRESARNLAPKNAPAASGAETLTASRRISSMASAKSASSPPAARVAAAGLPTDSAAALRQAAEIGDIAGLTASLEQQVDINARDASGRTALMLATLRGQTAAVEALLAHGADPNAGDARGITPLQVAVAGDQKTIVAALKRAGAR